MASRLASRKLWWLCLLITICTGTVVIDHLIAPATNEVVVLDEKGYQERVGSIHHGWQDPDIGSTKINAELLRLSDGDILQLSHLGDYISAGDTLEVQRTPVWKEALRYRKKGSRDHHWHEMDSNKIDYRPYPYLVFSFALLLLFPWPSDQLRWSLQAGLALMLLCWLVVMIGTGGLGRMMEWFW